MDKPTISPAAQYFFKHKGFGILVIVFLLLRLAISAFLPDQHYLQASDLTISNILNAVNRERSLRNLVTLNTNSKLSLAAQSKADDMIARKYFAHVDPDGHYIWDKIVADGYTPYSQLGENLAIEFYDTESLMNAWMNSPTHRANVLQEGFRDQGMGLSFGDVNQGQYYSAIANTFGTLAVSKTPIPPAQTQKPATQKTTTTPAPTTTKTSKPVSVPATATSPSTPTITTSTTPSQALALRGDGSEQNAQSSFALPTQEQATSATDTITNTPIQIPNESASAVVGDKDSTTLTNYEANRYLILIAGVVLLLLMGTDFKKAMESKLGSLDKKTNNIALLVIAIIVVAFMYWL